MPNIAEIARKLFPAATEIKHLGSEVNGLPKGTRPTNCDVLLSGDKADRNGRREFFLVDIDHVFVWLRVCTAMPGCGYDEFAVIHKMAWSDDDRDSLRSYATEFLSY